MCAMDVRCRAPHKLRRNENIMANDQHREHEEGEDDYRPACQRPSRACCGPSAAGVKPVGSTVYVSSWQTVPGKAAMPAIWR